MKKYASFIEAVEKEIRNWVQSADDRELFATLAEHKKKSCVSMKRPLVITFSG